jgi:hypothetical protein
MSWINASGFEAEIMTAEMDSSHSGIGERSALGD